LYEVEETKGGETKYEKYEDNDNHHNDDAGDDAGDDIIGKKRGPDTRDTSVVNSGGGNACVFSRHQQVQQVLTRQNQSRAEFQSPPPHHDWVATSTLDDSHEHMIAVSVSPRRPSTVSSVYTDADRDAPTTRTQAYSNWDIMVRVAIFAFALYMKM
jgi:hypothetical protein